MGFYYMPAARTPEQLAEMKRLSKEGICCFCPEHINRDKMPLIMDTDNWMVKANTYPYAHTSLHILIIPKEHITKMTQLTKPAQVEFYDVLEKCEKKYKLASYALVIRSGDMKHNGSSIEHLHVHVIVGDTKNPKHQSVKVKVSRKS